jgi:hypothetical protein
MEPTAIHQEVERGFRRLLEDNDLPGPDSVGYEAEAVWFYWHDRKVAVAVDFDPEGDGEVEFLAAEPVAG